MIYVQPFKFLHPTSSLEYILITKPHTSMKVLVASDDIGCVKEVIFARGTDTSKKDAIQPKSIKNFCGEPEASSKTKITMLEEFDNKFLVGARVGGEVSIYELTDNEVEDEEKFKLLHNYKVDVVKEDKPVALITLKDLDSIIIAFESSKVFLIHLNQQAFDFDPVFIQLAVTKPINTFERNQYEKGVFAYGGKENDVQIIRLYEQNASVKIFKKKDWRKKFSPKTIFTGKNVKNDHLDLRVPVSISKIRFFKENPKDGYKFLTATRHGQLRLYDTTHGRRPLHDYQVCEKPIIALAFANEEQSEVIITDTHSLIAKFSLSKIDEKAFKTNSASAGDIIRPVPKLLGKFAEGGNTGATFAVETAEEEIVATAGLDRYLRVFDIETREILAKVYVGVEISSVVILDIEDEIDEIEETGDKPVLQRKRRRDIQEAEESDDEEIWRQLDEKDGKKSKTK